MVIAIGGVSNSGKSKLARLLSNQFAERSVAVICQDDFVFPEEQLPVIYGHTDWERPETIDFKRLELMIRQASIENDYVIAEGLLIYCNPEITALFNKMIFIEISKEAFLDRKQGDLRWGQQPRWYISHIWDQYQKYGHRPAGLDMLVLDGERPWPLDEILLYLGK